MPYKNTNELKNKPIINSRTKNALGPNAIDKLHVLICISKKPSFFFYAALLPRRGPHIASHSVCPSVCLSVCLSVRPVIVTDRHVAPPSELQ